MDRFIIKNGKELKVGYTTGTCAAAAASAAAHILLFQEEISLVRITVPAGVTLELIPERIRRSSGEVSCQIRKEAGDDPDITDGMYIGASVRLLEGEEGALHFRAGTGVGTVTQPGLQIPVGEPAINPVPRQMIREAIEREWKHYGACPGMEVTIFAENGAEIAAKTFNPRLGIVGGISILGTSGLVEPMSERALIDTIHLEMDQQYLKHPDYVMLCPGNYGRDLAKEQYDIDIDVSVKCSNYIGESLDYAAYKGFQRILILGHAGKLIKLAAGIMNTHSQVADGRNVIMAAHGALCGASQELIRFFMEEAVTTDAMDQAMEELLREKVWNSIMNSIDAAVGHRIPGIPEYGVVLFTGWNRKIYVTEKAQGLLKYIRNEAIG